MVKLKSLWLLSSFLTSTFLLVLFVAWTSILLFKGSQPFWLVVLYLVLSFYCLGICFLIIEYGRLRKKIEVVK